MRKWLKITGCILIIISLQTFSVYAYNTPAGTTITNWADVTWSGGAKTNFISTNVMAIYGFTPVTEATQGAIFPGGIVELTNSITNNANTSMTLVINLSNFNMNGGYSGSDWRATILNITSQTIVGTSGGPITITNSISYGEVFAFILRIETTPDSLPGDWGETPVSLNIIGGDTNYYIKYQGDNNIWYGGTNVHTLNPRVTISGPYIALRKVLTVSNLTTLYAGGNPDIPVPDAIITYTNYYDNDGNAVATNLVIIDTIPTHTDFIVGSISVNPHTSGNATIEYANRAGIWGYIPNPTGPVNEDPNVGRIRVVFSGAAVGVDNGDTYGVADGLPQDTDAGYIWYKVVVHKRP